MTAYIRGDGGNVPGPTLKVAFCNFFHYKQPYEDSDIGTLLQAWEYSDPNDTFCDRCYAIPIDKIDRKLVLADPDRDKPLTQEQPHKRLFFMRYNFSSNML